MPSRERAMRGQRGDVGPGEHDAARVRRDVAGDQVEHRRFAGAVRPDDAERLTLLDREGEVIGRLERAVGFRDSVELEQNGHVRRSVLDRLERAVERDVRCRLVVDDVEIVFEFLARLPLAADQRRRAHVRDRVLRRRPSR